MPTLLSPPPPPSSLPTTQPTPFPPPFPPLPLPVNQPPPQFPRFFPSPFPLPFGFFPYHFLGPPHTTSLTTPPPFDLPLQPPLLPRPTTTLLPFPLPNKSLLPITTLKPSPQANGGCKGSFRVDSKTFSFYFDGGRAEYYAIHESRRNIKNFIWLSRKGLKWILLCFADICDWVPGKVFLCKRYRENNKFFVFRGRSNKAGIFVDIVVFYGGACYGCVMVPVSSNQSG